MALERNDKIFPKKIFEDSFQKLFSNVSDVFLYLTKTCVQMN